MKITDYIVVTLMIISSLAFYSAGFINGARDAHVWPSTAFKLESNP